MYPVITVLIDRCAMYQSLKSMNEDDVDDNNKHVTRDFCAKIFPVMILTSYPFKVHILTIKLFEQVLVLYLNAEL